MSATETRRKTAHRTRVSDLISSLRADIREGRYGVGDRLPSEALLCTELGVSRTVVREAMASLRAEGLVRSRQGSGVYVTDGPEDIAAPFRTVDHSRVSSVVEVLELRIAVETEAAALAAVRCSPAAEEVIVSRLDGFLSALAAGEATVEDDFQLHLAIARATGNARFADFLAAIGDTLIPRGALRPVAEGDSDKAYLMAIAEEHRTIVDAILDSDPDAARAAMRRHLDGSLRRYRGLMRRA